MSGLLAILAVVAALSAATYVLVPNSFYTATALYLGIGLLIWGVRLVRRRRG